MDCEKLDQHVIDALYGELDELTQAALERHAEGCSRCGPVYAGLKATRAVAVLPLEEPPVQQLVFHGFFPGPASDADANR